MCKISIIVPIYNAESFLHKCIDSILDQPFDDYELILINDGSKDRSGQICDSFALKEPKIKVLHKSNGGVSSARNLGLQHVTSKWILFVDSDDSLEEGALGNLSGYLDNDTLDLIQFNTTRTDLNFNIDTKLFSSLEDYHRYRYFQPALWNYLFKVDIVRKHNLSFSSELKYAEDLEFVFKYFSHIKEIQTLRFLVYNYMPADTSAMNTIPADLFINNNLLSISNVLDYIINKQIFKSFYSDNIYIFLKYTLRSILKYKFSDQQYAIIKGLYKRLYIRLLFFNKRILKYPLLSGAYASFSSTLSLLKIVWH